MIRRAAPAAVLLLALAGGCARKETEAPRFALDHCERVTVIDGATGAAVTGAEDLDIDRAGKRIFVSAYDRRRAEAAAARRDDAVPQGGLYAIDIAALNSGAPSVESRSLIDPSRVEGGLRPHGISFNQESGVLAFVNRGYVAEGNSWRRRIELMAFNPSQPDVLDILPADCAANDVASRDSQWLVTLDHGGCGWRAGFEDVTGAHSGRVVDDKGAEILTGLDFANGAVTAPDGRVVIAATRERALHVIDASNAVLPVKLSAAPDNLTVSDGGRVVAAVHPDLFALGLQRKLGIGRSPSRIVEVDLASGDQRLLFDDPGAERISAATAAIHTGELLVIGSVIDSGLVVCRDETAPR